MTEDQPMFDIQPTEIVVGCPVIARTIWGDERGVVSHVYQGYATIDLERGDRITLSLPRCVVADV